MGRSGQVAAAHPYRSPGAGGQELVSGRLQAAASSECCRGKGATPRSWCVFLVFAFLLKLDTSPAKRVG